MKFINPIELGIAGDGVAFRNLSIPQLVQEALERGEGTLSETGALVVKTGKYTGRSPNDKFIVDSPMVHDEIAWGKINVPIEKAKYEAIKAKVLAYLQNKDLYVFDGFAGADPKYTQRFRIVNELASQNLFIHQLLIRPTDEELENYVPDYTIYAAPGFKCIPEVDGVNSEAAIIIDYEAHEVLICGSGYAGEIKKSVFSVMNYVLPKNGILSMHCSANIGDAGDSAVFFGLSGTGKTTLSADPNRKLIGDDEHGWSPDGIFNIEGGCYAKCIDLDPAREPEIYGAIKFGALLENVVVDEEGKPDYFDGSLTENTRAGYPVDHIPNAAIPGVGGQPKTIVFLTADAFGVIPPISKLDNDMAMYHFVSGYTSKLAGTERGITEPVTTFSTLFGAPFFPLNASVYANMLGEKLKETGANVFLVNTGWCGGAAGTVPRMKLKYTRAMVTAALAGELDNVEYELDPIFNVNIPKSCPNVPSEILNPKNIWEDKAAYEASAKNLAKKFADNFAKKYPDMPANIVNAGPKAE
ncbi:MAG: phosphoenolpyruvate carboxykinase (ATP) [Oscillospiraceae bacterium]|nr:phosphoenolpyruvate carboxykinase (ATP) [Oscillospiraceae bacterium]